jgi:hypothetical protein
MDSGFVSVPNILRSYSVLERGWHENNFRLHSLIVAQNAERGKRTTCVKPESRE